MNNKYFLLRHGQTIYQTEKKDILYSWPEKTFTRRLRRPKATSSAEGRSFGEGGPVVLTKKGENQIKEAAKILRNKKLDLIYSSDVFRTRQTAGIVSKKLGIKPKFDKRLRDLDMGIFQGRPKIAYQKLFSSRKEKFKKCPAGGENWRDVILRLSGFLKEIEKNHKDKNILIISHGDPLWLLEGIIKGFESDEEFLKIRTKEVYPDVGQLIEIR